MSSLPQSLSHRVLQTAELFPSQVRMPSLAGLPRGRITEIIGPRSSGRTALMHSILAQSAARGETCALVDWANAFDPGTALRNGVVLESLLWVRCDHQPYNALKVADLLLNTGGFGVVMLDLYVTSPKTLRRIPLSWWYRLRRAIENAPAILAIAGNEPVAGSCASCIIEMGHHQTVWNGSVEDPLLVGIDLECTVKKAASGSIRLRAGIAE